MKRCAVFISGTGSNMMACLEKQNLAKVVCVVSSNPDAYGVLRARRHGIPVLIFTKSDSWSDLSTALKDFGVDEIFLAGFMRILPANFVQMWKNKILNVHPSLLPEYPGLKSIERAFQAGHDTGVTIHKVDEGVDTGEVLLQKKVLRQKDLATQEFFVHVTEHNLVRNVFHKGGA